MIPKVVINVNGKMKETFHPQKSKKIKVLKKPRIYVQKYAHVLEVQTWKDDQKELQKFDELPDPVVLVSVFAAKNKVMLLKIVQMP